MAGDMKTQGEDHHLQVKERGLEQIPCSEDCHRAHMLILDFQAAELWKWISVAEATQSGWLTLSQQP